MSFTNSLAPRPEFVSIPARVLEEASMKVPEQRRTLREVLSPAARKQREAARKYDVICQYKRLQRQAKTDKRREIIRERLKLHSLKRLHSDLTNTILKRRSTRRSHENGNFGGNFGRGHAEVLSVRHSTCSERFLESLIPLEIARTREAIIRRPELFELIMIEEREMRSKFVSGHEFFSCERS